MGDPTGTPDFKLLEDVDRLLEAAGIEYALGASGLLHALGLSESVGDWDLTTDADPERVAAALDGVPHEHVGSSGIHADQKLRLSGGTVELIISMALRSEGQIVHIPTIVRSRWRGIPLGSAEAWAVAYALMGRDRKADLLFEHLRERGSDPEATATLLREPLPSRLALRLRELQL